MNESQTSPLVLHARVVAGKGGGPDKTILNSPRYLSPLGYECVCVYLREPDDAGFEVLRERAVEKRAPLVEVDDFGFTDFGIVKRLRTVIEQHRSDAPLIWHGHDYKTNVLGWMLRRHFPELILVTTAHGWVHKTWKTPLYYAIDRWSIKRYQHVICVSRDLYDASRKLGLPESQVTLIDNAIALDDYEIDLDQDKAKQELGVSSDAKLVAAVGRLSDEKGFDILIDAVTQLIERGHNIELAIAGEGAFREALQSQIEATGHTDRIRLLGFVKDPRTVYRATDCYALSSYREGLPNVVLEAMTMRIPVVSTRIAGMPDLVEDGVNGVMIDPGSKDQLSAAIERVLTESELARRLVEAGRQTIESRFDFAKRMAKIGAIYDSLIKSTPS
ncbi:MAG: glycosyltransferase family 4 protein [Planctomycetota bacterium]